MRSASTDVCFVRVAERVAVTICALLTVVAAACNDGPKAPTLPTNGSTAAINPPGGASTGSVKLSFILAAPGGKFTHSQPVRCANPVATTCGAQAPSSPFVTATTTERSWALSPGSYEIAGILDAGSAALGVEVLGFAFVGATGVPAAKPIVSIRAGSGTSEVSTCGGHVGLGRTTTLQWSLVFDVVGPTPATCGGYGG